MLLLAYQWYELTHLSAYAFHMYFLRVFFIVDYNKFCFTLGSIIVQITSASALVMQCYLIPN